MNDQPGRRRTAAADEQALSFVTAFLATSVRQRSGDPEHDRLADLDAARRWVDTAVGERASVSLAEDDLAPLRAFREELRTSLSAAGDPATGASVVTAVDLHWRPGDGLGFRPAADGWRAIAALVTMDMLLAQAAGRLRRLKTCAYDPCGYPFVDHSPNLTRNWHDTSRCGNVVNLRASRARRK